MRISLRPPPARGNCLRLDRRPPALRSMQSWSPPARPQPAWPDVEVADRLEPTLASSRTTPASPGFTTCARTRTTFIVRRPRSSAKPRSPLASARAGQRFHEIELHWWLFWQLPQGPRPVDGGDRAMPRAPSRSRRRRGRGGGVLRVVRAARSHARPVRRGTRAIASSIAIRDRLGIPLLTAKYALPALGRSSSWPASRSRPRPPFAPRTTREPYGRPRDRFERPASWPRRCWPRIVWRRLRAAPDRRRRRRRRRRPAGAVVLRAGEDQEGRGKPADATSSAREAVRLTLDTDDLNLQGVALLTLAEVSGDAAHADEASNRFTQKGNIVSAAAARTSPIS